jgi:hypothetical protein
MHELSSPTQNTRIVDSNPTWGMDVCPTWGKDVCVCLFCVCTVLCVQIVAKVQQRAVEPYIGG